MRQPNPREVSEANEQPGRGKRSAAPTRDTAEPAPPGRWCRPLEGLAYAHIFNYKNIFKPVYFQ